VPTQPPRNLRPANRQTSAAYTDVPFCGGKSFAVLDSRSVRQIGVLHFAEGELPPRRTPGARKHEFRIVRTSGVLPTSEQRRRGKKPKKKKEKKSRGGPWGDVRLSTPGDQFGKKGSFRRAGDAAAIFRGTAPGGAATKVGPSLD